MSITLGGIALPNGLRWEDEYAWSAVVQSTEHTLTGALVVEEATKQAGRPITLVGGRTWAWVTRATLDSLRTLLEAAGTPRTLVLHDARSFTVMGVRDGDKGPIEASPVPIVRDSGPADPVTSTKYIIERIRLIEVPT